MEAEMETTSSGLGCRSWAVYDLGFRIMFECLGFVRAYIIIENHVESQNGS